MDRSGWVMTLDDLERTAAHYSAHLHAHWDERRFAACEDDEDNTAILRLSAQVRPFSESNFSFGIIEILLALCDDDLDELRRLIGLLERDLEARRREQTEQQDGELRDLLGPG